MPTAPIVHADPIVIYMTNRTKATILLNANMVDNCDNSLCFSITNYLIPVCIPCFQSFKADIASDSEPK